MYPFGEAGYFAPPELQGSLRRRCYKYLVPLGTEDWSHEKIDRFENFLTPY